MEILLYTQPECTWCAKLKDWLKKNNHAFQECDLSESSTYRDELLQKTSQLAAPVLDIDGEMIIGFNPEKIEKVIKMHK